MPQSGLVIASYVLGELAAEASTALIELAWAACSGVLLIVEPDTPAANGRIVGPVAIPGPGAELSVGKDGNLGQVVVAKRDGAALRRVSKRGWGDPA